MTVSTIYTLLGNKCFLQIEYETLARQEINGTNETLARQEINGTPRVAFALNITGF